MVGTESLRGLPPTTIHRVLSHNLYHPLVYVILMDGDPRLDCRVRRALELLLGVVAHLQGEDPMADEGTDHPHSCQALAL